MKAVIYSSDKFKVNVSIRNKSHFLIILLSYLLCRLAFSYSIVPCIYDVNKKIDISSLTPPRIYSPVISAILAKLMNAESHFKCIPNKVSSTSIEVITLNEGLIFVKINKIVSLPCSQLGSK